MRLFSRPHCWIYASACCTACIAAGAALYAFNRADCIGDLLGDWLHLSYGPNGLIAGQENEFSEGSGEGSGCAFASSAMTYDGTVTAIVDREMRDRAARRLGRAGARL